MREFPTHTKTTRILSVTLFLTGVLGLVFFLISLPKILAASSMAAYVMGGLTVGLTALGIASGIGLWRRHSWALNAAIVYFAVQVIAVRTPHFFFGIHSGFHLFVHVSLTDSTFVLNVFAVAMCLLAIYARAAIKHVHA